jgi:23S rRNA U2552 (ribose-2'-O)-methylase RlmE/FtsJ
MFIETPNGAGGVAPVAASGNGVDTHSKCCNGLSYYNHFSLPQVGMNYDRTTQDVVPIPICITTVDSGCGSGCGGGGGAYVSSSVYTHLCNIKQQIEKYQDAWDNIKKSTNPYEYIHTNISGNKTNISKLRPLSRSFYKMIEIIKNYNILAQYSNTICDKPDVRMGIQTFHLAEGPGGFIEAVAHLRGLEYQTVRAMDTTMTTPTTTMTSGFQILKRNTELHDEVMKELEHLKISRRIFENQKAMAMAMAGTTATTATTAATYGNDRYYGMTLVNDDPICPGWKKTRTFLEQHPNVIIETGADKTGNLISLQNFQDCAAKYRNKMDLITADGGFDFSVDFNNQENMAAQLILCEVFYALAIQKQGGTFILKIFDVFHKPTVDILYLLCYYYNNVSIMKPHTSRVANSEKYVICQGFKVTDSTPMIEQIVELFPTLSLSSKDDRTVSEIISILPDEHDLFFLNKIEEMNAMLSFQQIENITSTLSIITNHRNVEKLDQFKKANINKCVAWCEYYDIPYNLHHQTIQSTNIFLHRTSAAVNSPVVAATQ